MLKSRYPRKRLVLYLIPILMGLGGIQFSHQLDSYAWWQESVLLPHLLLMEGWFRGFTGTLRDLIVGLGN